MKGLLQSKRFKKNIGKWLIMYGLCMGLFTTLVTYSKYISKMLSTNDGARVSKFDISLKYCENENCDNGGSNTPSDKRYAPYNEIVYYFAVDTSTLEVNAELILTARILDNHFKLKEIKEITNSTGQINNISKNSTSGDTISITTNVKAGDKNLRKYKVTIVYDETVVDYNKPNCTSNTTGCKVVNGIVKDNDSNIPKYIFDETKKYAALEIGYSLKQTK